MVDEDEGKVEDYDGPVGQPVGRPAVIRLRAPPTHPPTRRNDGRPAPTVVWASDKPKRIPPPEVGGARTRRRDGMAMREFQEILQEYSGEETEDEDKDVWEWE